VDLIAKTASSALLLQSLITLRNLVRSGEFLLFIFVALLIDFVESMQELQQHMITNELIRKLEVYRKGTEPSQQAVIANCVWILANMVSCQKELKQFAIEHKVIQEVMLTMELFKYTFIWMFVYCFCLFVCLFVCFFVYCFCLFICLLCLFVCLFLVFLVSFNPTDLMSTSPSPVPSHCFCSASFRLHEALFMLREV
jgi:hypothetical protein